MEPKVSICIPTYNQIDKLQILFDSIRIQTFRDFEVIVSDDSSTDDVKQLVDRYEDLSIRYYRNSPAKGSPENWNHAISLAISPWIKIMHHDDYFSSENSLQEFTEFADLNPQIDYFYCGTNLHKIEDNDFEISRYWVDEGILKNIKHHSAYLFPKNIIGSPSVGFHKKGLKISFDNSLVWLVDVDYFIQLLFKCEVAYLDKPLVTTIESQTQLSNRMSMNPDFELYELTYCYNKWYNNYNKLNRKIMRLRFIYFLNEFQIFSLSKVKVYTKNLRIPTFVKLFCLLAYLSPKIANSVLYRFNHYQLLKY